MFDFSLLELELLVSQVNAPCISIYMPFDWTNVSTDQRMARMNHLLRQAERLLIAKNLRRPDAAAILSPARALMRNMDFWQQSHKGIVLFLAPNFVRYFDDSSIAVEFSEMVAVDDHFYIQPILDLLTGNGQFYILVLDQQHFKLLHGTRATILPIQMEGAPPDIHMALGDHCKEFGSYTPIIYRDRTLRYSRMVNWAVHRYLVAGKAPLILAGTAYQRAIYHQANTYPYLLNQDIEQNVERLPVEELNRLAWEIAEPLFSQARQEAIDRFRQHEPTGMPSTALRATLDTACSGQVDTLFITEGNRPFRMFHSKTMRYLETSKQVASI